MDEEQNLGKKTLWLFALQNLAPAIAIFLLILGSFFAKAWVPSGYGDYFNYAILGELFFFVIFFIAGLIIAWLIYSNYKFALAPEALKVRQGVFSKEETAIPYGRIQSVDLHQTLIERMLGLCRIVILTAAHDLGGEKGEAEVEFPALDIEVGRSIQSELLQRSKGIGT